MKKTITLVIVAIIFAACGTQKKFANSTVAPPEGIGFTKIENFKGFATINLPYDGLGFEKNLKVSVPKNQTDAGVFVPGVLFENNQLIIWSNIGSTKGDIDAQYEVVKKQFINHIVKDSSELIFEKKTIDNLNVGFVQLSTPIASGMVKHVYGYIIPHKNSAALFLISNALLNPDELNKFDYTLDQAFQYMIKTVKFQDN